MAESVVKRGSVVLIRYPFTDLTGVKVRPALVVTPDQLLPRLQDVLCLFISSSMPEGFGRGRSVAHVRSRSTVASSAGPVKTCRGNSTLRRTRNPPRHRPGTFRQRDLRRRRRAAARSAVHAQAGAGRLAEKNVKIKSLSDRVRMLVLVGP